MNFSIDEFKNDDFGSASLKFLQEIHLNSKMNLKSNGLLGALIALKIVGEWHNKFELYLTEIKKNFIKRIKESKFNKSKDIERVGSFGEGEHGVFNDAFSAIVGVTVFISYVIYYYIVVIRQDLSYMNLFVGSINESRANEIVAATVVKLFWGICYGIFWIPAISVPIILVESMRSAFKCMRIKSVNSRKIEQNKKYIKDMDAHLSLLEKNECFSDFATKKEFTLRIT